MAAADLRVGGQYARDIHGVGTGGGGVRRVAGREHRGVADEWVGKPYQLSSVLLCVCLCVCVSVVLLSDASALQEELRDTNASRALPSHERRRHGRTTLAPSSLRRQRWGAGGAGSGMRGGSTTSHEAGYYSSSHTACWGRLSDAGLRFAMECCITAQARRRMRRARL